MHVRIQSAARKSEEKNLSPRSQVSGILVCVGTMAALLKIFKECTKVHIVMHAFSLAADCIH